MDDTLPEELLVAATQTFPEERELTWRPPAPQGADPRDVFEVQAFFFAKRAAAAKAAAACVCVLIVACAAAASYA